MSDPMLPASLEDRDLRYSAAITSQSCRRIIRNSILIWLVVFAFYQIAAPNYRWLPDKGDTPYGADFLQEWVGARIVLEGESKTLYNSKLFQSRQHDERLLGFTWVANAYFPPVYPPMHYAAFVPFALIPYRWAVLLWLGILIAFAILAAHQIQSIALRYRCNTFASPSRYRTLQASVWVGIFMFPAVLSSLTMGQKSVIWLVILTSTWQLLLRKRELAAGFIFGLLSVKPTLFFLLPLVFLSHGKIRFFSGASITVAALWGTGLCVMPAESWFGFLEAVQGSSSYPGMNGYRLDWSCNLLSLAYAIPAPFQSWFKQSVCVILAIYCLICCFERRKTNILSPEKLLLMLCATFLLSPHAYSYDLCLFLLPVFLTWAQQPRMGFAYYALLTMTVAVSAVVLNTLHLPILPIILIGIICEMRLRTRSSENATGHSTNSEPNLDHVSMASPS